MPQDRKSADRYKQGLSKSKNNKPSQFKKKGDFRIGGTYSTGRAITIGIPGAKKKKAMTGSKEKRTAGPSVGRSQRRPQGSQPRGRQY
jgi:hypothetical protein